MGFFVRVAIWTAGIIAVIVAAFTVYNAFFGGPHEPPSATSGPPACPPQVSLAPRAPGAPVDDVAGVRIGFSVADAQATLRCRDPRYTFSFEPIWHTAVPSSTPSRQRMSAANPPELITLGLSGSPGQEVVYAVFQDLQYGEAAQTPTPEAVAAMLTSHYGGPHARQNSPNRIDLWWLYAPDGKPIRPANGPNTDPFTALSNWIGGTWNFGKCQKHVTLDPMASPSWDVSCGISIHAQIDARKDKPTQIARYRIVVVDQARLAAAVENYRERLGIKTPG